MLVSLWRVQFVTFFFILLFEKNKGNCLKPLKVDICHFYVLRSSASFDCLCLGFGKERGLMSSSYKIQDFLSQNVHYSMPVYTVKVRIFIFSLLVCSFTCAIVPVLPN